MTSASDRLLLGRRGFAAGCLTLAAPAIVRAEIIRPRMALKSPCRLIDDDGSDAALAAAMDAMEAMSPDSSTSAAPFFSASFLASLGFTATPTGLSALGLSNWKSTSGAGEVNYFLGAEQEYYQGTTSRYNPFSLAAGKLSITASNTGASSNPAGHPYTSGLINTYTLPGGTFSGARIDVRARLPSGAGLWPAIWLLPTNNQWPPEIDIMEMLGEDPTTIYCSLHWGPDGNDASNDKYSQAVKVPDTSAGFHNYGLDFDSTVANGPITFYFDNKPVYTTTLPSRMYGQVWFMMINLAVGGASSWGGAPTASTLFPATMYVDHVRMYPPGTVLS